MLQDIKLFINSPGGSVTAGMGIYDAMQMCRSDVSTVCFGLAASMGAFLLTAGAKGKRLSMPNARIMIHQPLGGAQGQAADIEIQANEIMHHKATLNGYLAEFCGKPLDRIMEDTDRDFFMGAQDAVDYGLIDGVLSNERWKAFQQKGLPLYPVCACPLHCAANAQMPALTRCRFLPQTRATTLCSRLRASCAMRLIDSCETVTDVLRRLLPRRRARSARARRAPCAAASGLRAGRAAASRPATRLPCAPQCCTTRVSTHDKRRVWLEARTRASSRSAPRRAWSAGPRGAT